MTQSRHQSNNYIAILLPVFLLFSLPIILIDGVPRWFSISWVVLVECYAVACIFISLRERNYGWLIRAIIFGVLIAVMFFR